MSFINAVRDQGAEAIFDQVFGTPWDEVLAKRPTTTVINGISIGEEPWLKDWYVRELPQGDGSFAMNADSFEAFGNSIKQKLIREITQAPIPSGYD